MLLNIPKILHLYWAHESMSWLQTRTVTSFHKQNPDWEIRIYMPLQGGDSSVNYIPTYEGLDYFNLLLDFPYITIIKVDLSAYGMNLSLHSILRSDILRYYLLYEFGGVWSDFDVLWIKPMDELLKIKGIGIGSIRDIGVSICYFQTPSEIFHSIGVLLARPHHPFYKCLIEACNNLQNALEYKDRVPHQIFGANLFLQLLPNSREMLLSYSDLVIIPYSVFYPYSIFNLRDLYVNTNMELINEDTIAIHWFNGHKRTKEYINNDCKSDCTMTNIINLINQDLL